MITSQNIFAALDTKKKKKSSSKSKDADDKKKKKAVSKADRSAELERAIFSGPKVSITNWADTDDEDEIDELPESWSAPVRRGPTCDCAGAHAMRAMGQTRPFPITNGGPVILVPVHWPASTIQPAA
jgi:hypothetical protein